MKYFILEKTFPNWTFLGKQKHSFKCFCRVTHLFCDLSCSKKRHSLLLKVNHYSKRNYTHAKYSIRKQTVTQNFTPIYVTTTLSVT